MNYLLLAALVSLLLLSYWLNHGDIVCPAFIFCASFLFATIWAVVYAEKWDLSIHANTFYVITGGVLEFLMVSQAVHLFFRSRTKHPVYWCASVLPHIKIQKEKIQLFIAFEILTILLSASFLTRSLGAGGLADAIFLYRYGNIADRVAMPSYLNIMRICVNSSAYWFAYIFVNNLVVTKKADLRILLAAVLALVNTVVVGSRGNVVYVLTASIAIYYYLSKKNSIDSDGRISIKGIVLAIGIVSVLAFSYQALGNLLGRNSTANLMDYLAIYCGAEIKNLDLMLQTMVFKSSRYFGEQTFINLYKWLGPRFGIREVGTATLFLSVNGYNLGNVYTTFYSFLYDFGYEGVFFLVLIMATISQWLYELIRREKRAIVDTRIVAYGYIFNTLLFSYFSNKFYEQVFSAVFLYSLIFWVLFKLFFVRIRFVTKRS